MNKNELDLAYVAGFLDGEGCITTCGATFRVTVSNTNYEILQWMHENYGGCLNGQYLPANPKHSPAWKWILSKRGDVYEFLTLVIPFLKIKKAEALEVIEWLDRNPSVGGGNRHSQATKDDFVQTKDRLRRLKTDNHYDRS